MKLVIVSGFSGSGKTVALHTLEDSGYYCIDNLPLGMLPKLIDNMTGSGSQSYDRVAIAIDARSRVDSSDRFDEILRLIGRHKLELKVLFLTCDSERLLRRFSETRRKHPLSQAGLPLADAIRKEKELLEEIHVKADLAIDTTSLNVHELRHRIISHLLSQSSPEMDFLLQSFGFKNGVPADSDFVFDVRCLPNPHWEEALKPLSGRDQPVVDYLESYDEVTEMFSSIYGFLETWIPRFEMENRSYMTVSVGCTGGRHRSVYLVERLAGELSKQRSKLSVRHRDLA